MAVIFYIFRAKAWLLSKLPLRALYILSDFLAFFLKYVVRYRREVILGNLRRSFPEKDEKEIHSIASEYYRNLSDVIIEVIKWRSIRREEIHRRFKFQNNELMSDAFGRGKNVILAIGHCGNWEWMGTAFDTAAPQMGYAVVKPLTDKRFDKYLQFLRLRISKGSTIPFKNTFRFMARESRKEPFFAVFAADQTPTRDEIGFWMRFLHQDTGFFMGIEKIARALDMAVIFMDIRREKRGRYTGVMSLITDDPRAEPDYEISKKYVRKLESAIRRDPSNWLWSHRRWKHAPSENDPVHN